MSRPKPNVPPQPQRRPIHWALALGGVLLLALLVRLVGIGDQPHWLDDLWTIELAAGHGSQHLTLPRNQVIESPPALTSLDGAPGIWRVWTGMDDATHPPLYFVVLRLWMNLFGTGEVATRSLSVICSLLAISLLYDTVKRLSGARAALWAAALMALAEPMIQYAQAPRNYAFLLLTALAAGNLLVRIELSGASWGRLALLATALLATALTHYFAAGSLLALLAYAAIRLRGPQRWKTLGAFAAAALLFAALWGPFMVRQMGRFSTQDVTTEFLHRGGGSAAQDTLLDLALLPMRFLRNAGIDPAHAGIDLAPVGYAAGVFWILPLLLWRRRDMLLWSLWTLTTVGLLLAMDLTRHTAHLAWIRYSLLAAPGAYAILAGLFPNRKDALPHLLPALALLLCCVALPHLFSLENPDYRSVARELDRRASENDLIILYARNQDAYLQWSLQLGVTHYTKHPRRPVVLMYGYGELPPEVRRFERIWLVNQSARQSPDVVTMPDLPGYTVDPALALHPLATVHRVTPR